MDPHKHMCKIKKTLLSLFSKYDITWCNINLPNKIIIYDVGDASSADNNSSWGREQRIRSLSIAVPIFTSH